MAPVEKKVLPVEEEEEDDEIEEGEIVEDTDEELDEEIFDDDDEEEGEEIGGLGDIADMAASLFATPDGDTVASTLVGIREQLETQNRILIKIFSVLKD